MGRILLVDDEESVLFAVYDYFTVRGHEVVRASDRDAAERLLDEGHFSWLITDLHLTPGRTQDGIGIARKARSLGVDRVVLLTAHRTAEVDAAALDAGIDRVMGKPVLLADLESALTGSAARA